MHTTLPKWGTGGVTRQSLQAPLAHQARAPGSYPGGAGFETLAAHVKTSWQDRFKAWIADPETPENPTLEDAFREGFTQCMEWLSGQVREHGWGE